MGSKVTETHTMPTDPGGLSTCALLLWHPEPRGAIPSSQTAPWALGSRLGWGKTPLWRVEKLPCTQHTGAQGYWAPLLSVSPFLFLAFFSNLKMEKNNERPRLGNQVERIYIKAKCEGSKLQHRENGGC